MGLAKSVIVNNFRNSASKYASLPDESFVDSKLDISTLSENMTIDKLSQIIKNIKNNNYNNYAGVIVLHGTDTLAYTATLFSIIFADSEVPIMLVSANRPPDDPYTNANINFTFAVDCIMSGIAPNVYVPYRNSDGRTHLHIASMLLQCSNFSEDFYDIGNSPLSSFECNCKKHGSLITPQMVLKLSTFVVFKINQH